MRRNINKTRLCKEIEKAYELALLTGNSTFRVEFKKDDEGIMTVNSYTNSHVVPNDDLINYVKSNLEKIGDDGKLEDFDLAVRSYHCLKRSGCDNISDVKELIRTDKLSKVRNLGEKSYGEILITMAKLIQSAES